MKNGQLQLIAPQRETHLEPMLDLIAKVFSHSGYFNFRQYCAKSYVDHSHYDWQASRIGLRDGQILSHYGVWDYPMRIGTARVRVGGIGVVATHGECRKQGLMAQTGMASVQAMRQLGYDMSILFGIDDFYHRFGYVRAWSDTDWFIQVNDLPKDGSPARVRRFAPRPRADIEALFNRHNARITGSAVRPTYPRSYTGYRPEQRGYLWNDARGKLAGYVFVRAQGARLVCSEVVGDAQQALAVLRGVARKLACHEVLFETLPYASELCRRLRQLNCRCETQFRRRGRAMIRTINLASTLTKMSGELGRRLKQSHLADWRGKLRVSDGRDEVVLDISRLGVRAIGEGSTRHTIRGGDAIAQLIIGTDEPQEIVEAAGMH